MWTFNAPAWMHEYSQLVHLFGFSPECVFLCITRWLAWGVLESHWLHWFSFSPLWTIEWVFKWSYLLNDLSHCGHLCSLSPLWMIECLFKCHARLVSASSGYNQVLHQSLCTTSNVNNILNFKFWFSLFKFYLFVIFNETGRASKPPVGPHHFQCQQHSPFCYFIFFITSKNV